MEEEHSAGFLGEPGLKEDGRLPAPAGILKGAMGDRMCQQEYSKGRGRSNAPACDYLSRNGEEFKDFLLMNANDGDVSDIDGYVERMKKDGRWGGNVELEVASRAFGRNIIIFGPSIPMARC